MDQTAPRLCQPPCDWTALLQLIRESFAYMERRIDPPSSMLALTADQIRQQALTHEVWAIGEPAVACMFLTPRADSLYLGKLAVAREQRGRGLARRLIETAAARAHALGLPAITLSTRIELVENQATFRALGFAVTGYSSHPGFDRPTSVEFRKEL